MFASSRQTGINATDITSYQTKVDIFHLEFIEN